MDRYEEVLNYYNDKLLELNNVKDLEIKKLVIVTLLDSLAQEYGNYSNGNFKMFENFVLKFSKNYCFLDDIDIVTLYYKEQEKFKNNGFDLSFLEDSYNYIPKQIVGLNKTKEMLKFAKNNISDETIRKHKYINLIYKYRSKLVHEHNSIGTNFSALEENKMISYLSFGVTKIYWKLNIPFTFLEELFKECLNNYIVYCKEKNIDPFENHQEDLSWEK